MKGAIQFCERAGTSRDSGYAETLKSAAMTTHRIQIVDDLRPSLRMIEILRIPG
jgi:hypothetical protein